MKICTRCVLPETFPTVGLDSEGVCRYCRTFQSTADQDEMRNGYLLRFEELLKAKSRNGTHDIIVAYSGGKDSSYLLYLLKSRFNLRILAFTFDNGFMSNHASRNIRSMAENLGVDHLVFKPDFDLLKGIFRLSIEQQPYSPKSLERASAICTTCMLLVKAAILKTALEKRIPFIGYGWTPGQAPIQSSVMKTSAMLIRSSLKPLREMMEGIGPGRAPVYFPSEEDLENEKILPYNIHPLAFLAYEESEIYGQILKLGWSHPDDTDPNSTNCLLNAFANHVHIRKHHFHPYAFEIAGLVRLGVMTRSEGLSRLEERQGDAMVGQVGKVLGYKE